MRARCVATPRPRDSRARALKEVTRVRNAVGDKTVTADLCKAIFGNEGTIWDVPTSYINRVREFPRKTSAPQQAAPGQHTTSTSQHP